MASYELQSAKDALTRDAIAYALDKARATLESGISKDNHQKLLEESFAALKQTDISQYESTRPTT